MWVALLCLVSVLGLAASADAQRRPTYASPTFKGSAKAPPTRPATPPPAVPLASDGLHPDMLVDEAGTAHVVWATGRGEDADGAVYCRLKRGARACDTTTTLVPDKPYGTGDGPQYNIDNGGPKIVRVGDQLVILSYRYPTVFDRPDEAGSGGVVQWTSDDGGTTWTGGVLAARHDLNGGAVAFGPPEAPRIATIAHTGPCGPCVQEIRGGTYNGASANLGDEGPDRNYDANLQVDGGVPVATFADLQNTTYVRRWTGAEPLTSPATWTPSLAVPGVEPFLAAGPAGLFLMNRPGFGQPFVLRKVAAAAAGAASRVSDADHDAVFGRLAQDPSGRLLAAWQNRRAGAAGGDPAGVYLRTGPGGTALGGSQLLLAGDANGQLELSAAQDGGGFLVANRTGGVNTPGEIVATAFGTRASTGQPGIKGLPGGSDPSVTQACEQTRFGAVRVLSTAGCFLRGTGALSRVSVSEGEVDLNGLRIVPDAGVKIVIDPRERKLWTTGSVRVLLTSGGVTVTLWHGALKLHVPTPSAGAVLASFDTSNFPTGLLGFGMRGRIDVVLTATGVRIPVSLALPPYLGDVRGAAELLASTGRGLELRSLKIHVGTIPLGPLVIEYFDLDYQGEGEVWDGRARLVVPAGGALDGSVRFTRGSFTRGELALEPPPPGIPIGPLVYLTRIGGAFGLDPTQIGAQARIAAGAQVNGVAPVSVTGRLDATFPRSGPFTLVAGGELKVLFLDLADARFRFISDGYADFLGRIGFALPAVSLNGMVDGFVDGSKGAFGASARVDLCVDLEVGPFKFPCVGGDLALSQTGMAACASADLPEPVGSVSGGLELPWNALTGAEIVNPLLATATIVRHLRTPCSTGAFRVPPRARAAQAGGPVSVTVPAGLPTATIALTGEGAPPDVDVAGPGGAGLPPGSYVAKSAALNTSYVVLARPAAGAWTFTPRPGSAAIAQVLQSAGFTPANVRGSVRRDGDVREIRYAIDDLENQTVAFAEDGAFGTRIIGTATKPDGTLRFRPAGGRAGTRTVVALVQHDGLVIKRVTLGRFAVAAPPPPGRARDVRVRRRGSSATIAWGAAPRAARYLVRVRGSHGLRRQFLVRRRQVRLVRLAPGDRITATVTGLSASGRRGTAVRSRAVR